jgi:hypothetical protein
LRHVLNVTITYPCDEDEEKKPEGDSQRSDEDSTYLLVRIPVVIGYIYSPPLNRYTGHRDLNPLQEYVLEQVMDVDS